MKARSRMMLALAVIVAAIGFLTYTSVKSASVYYYNVDEFARLTPQAQHNYVQVHGTVVPGSVTWNRATQQLAFTIQQNGSKLNVLYQGPKPDTFQPGIETVVSGRLAAHSRFVADRLLVKCPSKYTPAPASGG